MANSMRKLAAIMFTDIVGFTAFMGDDEKKAMDMLRKNREVQKPLIEKYNGSWLKEIGDGTLSSFPSALEALNCAIEIQRLLKKDPKHNLRIGIHVGDVIFEDGDVFGAGVNVASRIEPMAVPGGICITEPVYDAIRNHAEIKTIDLGSKKLKNVDHRINVYAVKGASLESPQAGAKPDKAPDQHVDEYLGRQKYHSLRRTFKQYYVPLGILAIIILSLIFYPRNDLNNVSIQGMGEIDSKSIAVLPFSAFSAEAEDLFFADGVHDDILTQLSKIKDLIVISRTSVVQYKNTTKTMKQIAQELNVKNILEGSVRRAGNQIRIVAQLINATTDEHIWSETYDRNYANIFSIQSDVAKKIATALKATLTSEEKAYIEEKPTENLDAYDFYLRGNDYFRRSNSEEELRIAIQMYTKAVELDPNFALAHAFLSRAYTNLFWFGGRSRKYLVDSKTAVDRALSLRSDLAEARIALGEYLNKGFQNYSDALENFTQALQTRPNNSDVFSAIAHVQKRQGQWDKALTNYVKAVKLDPRSPSKTIQAGLTYLYMREYEDAERLINRSIALAPDNRDSHTYAAWLQLLWKGDKKEALKVIGKAPASLTPERIISGGNVYFNNRGLWRFDLIKNSHKKTLDKLSGDFFGKDRISHMFAKAQIFDLNADFPRMTAFYDSLRILLEKKIQDQPNSFRLHLQLGISYARMGLMEQAKIAGLKAVELMPISLCHW